jgi:DNA-binding transcriptional MerR regulator
MPRRKIEVKTDPLAFLEKDEIELPAFSFGAVSKILGLETWRFQKFLDSPRYQLRASGQVGEGQGSRKWFSTEDVYRIGIANFLTKDGFAPKLIAQVLDNLDDQDLFELDEEGNQVRPGFVALSRTKTGRGIQYSPSHRPPEISLDGPVYYVLDVGKLTQEIDSQIETLTAKKDRK